MSFPEAFKELLAGKRIRRKNFKGYWFQDPESGLCMIHLENGKEISYGKLDLTIRNCAASDWEVVEA